MRLLLGAALCCAASAAFAADGHWVAAWYSPPFPPTAVWSCNQVRTFSHQTVRQVVQLEAAGDRVRIRLTNELGLGPLQFDAVHVALSSPNGVTEPGTDRVRHVRRQARRDHSDRRGARQRSRRAESPPLPGPRDLRLLSRAAPTLPATFSTSRSRPPATTPPNRSGRRAAARRRRGSLMASM